MNEKDNWRQVFSYFRVKIRNPGGGGVAVATGTCRNLIYGSSLSDPMAPDFLEFNQFVTLFPPKTVFIYFSKNSKSSD